MLYVIPYLSELSIYIKFNYGTTSKSPVNFPTVVLEQKDLNLQQVLQQFVNKKLYFRANTWLYEIFVNFFVSCKSYKPESIYYFPFCNLCDSKMVLFVHLVI